MGGNLPNKNREILMEKNKSFKMVEELKIIQGVQ